MATSHTIRLELGPAGAHREVPDDHERLLDFLALYSPAVSVTDVGRLEVIVSLPADSVGQAVTTALALLTQFGRPDVAAVEAMTTKEFDRRVALPLLPELLSVTEAAERLGMTRQSVLERIKAGTLAATRVGSTYAISAVAVETTAPRRQLADR
ncbi:excisionase family DNA-binding protein [Pseudokineococcus lusitanus]|uniref:Excisionase family DNA binding protein n=1 Tax=Pseudokineococcus lusitanus TaxID=763993 RepID=A0A3N1HU24_9ACTN|nr:excisionase family DNA-binding protein [Pseudokineococcus lusitanus]ROP45969.1 excisionase family DNA binding protein [Pseudokineococcus lusitanus]